MAVLLFVSLGHCETTKERLNSIGADQLVTNPYTYILGLPIDGQVLEGKYTTIRLWPYGASALYDVSILFCGDVTYSFHKKGVVVVTYRIQASHTYKGIACHDLLGVFEVPVVKWK
jgi:hypothetical protein